MVKEGPDLIFRHHGPFFSRNDHRCHVVTSAVRHLHTSHTAANIRNLVDEILEEWDIAPDKVSAVITINGSNMVAAFKSTLDKTEEDNDAKDFTLPDDADDSLDHEMKHDVKFCSLKRIASPIRYNSYQNLTRQHS